MKLDGFLLAIISAVLLALLAPGLGLPDGPLHLGLLTRAGIALVFFLHGANLSPAALRAGASNWPVHLVVQLTTYALFPALGFALYFGLAPWLGAEARLGIFFLCALSSTVSSSVAMTSLARGNVAAAVFDASLSGILGMVITPTLVALIVSVEGRGIALLPAIRDVMATLLVPFGAGQVVRGLLAPLLAARKRLVNLLDRGVIVLIVYSAFCESTASGLWHSQSALVIAAIGLIAAGLLALVLVTTTLVARTLQFPLVDEVATVFCGSKKSLANGAPIARVLFAGSPALGMIMLPLLLYHQLQLVVCAVLARRYAVRIGAGEG